MNKNWLVVNLNNKYFLRAGKKVFECQIGDGGFSKAIKKLKATKQRLKGNGI